MKSLKRSGKEAKSILLKLLSSKTVLSKATLHEEHGVLQQLLTIREIDFSQLVQQIKEATIISSGKGKSVSRDTKIYYLKYHFQPKNS